MIADGVKVVWIAPEEEVSYRRRPDFAPIEMYGSMKPEPCELGSLFRMPRGSTDRRDAIVLARVFIVQPERSPTKADIQKIAAMLKAHAWQFKRP